jgi:NitT/TauT family transport system substrate-binding protein
LPYTFTTEVKDLIEKASNFLVEIKSIRSKIRSEAVMPSFTEEILKNRNLKAPVGAVKALPEQAYKGQ